MHVLTHGSLLCRKEEHIVFAVLGGWVVTIWGATKVPRGCICLLGGTASLSGTSRGGMSTWPFGIDLHASTVVPPACRCRQSCSKQSLRRRLLPLHLCRCLAARRRTPQQQRPLPSEAAETQQGWQAMGCGARGAPCACLRL